MTVVGGSVSMESNGAALAVAPGRRATASGQIVVGRDDGALRPGDRIRSYQLVSRLAIGAVSEVWLAKLNGAQGFEKSVVLKLMANDPARRELLADLMTDEATIGARLYHPGIVHLLDFAHADARCFIAMEHLEGVNLRQAAARLANLGHRFPVPLLVHVGTQLCRSLHYGHELSDGKGPLGFIHRGITPENLMFLRSGAVKLIDFGASRMRSISGPPGAEGTTLPYVAPERLRGQPEDRRGDLYAMGAVLYELLCGRRPFEGDDASVRTRILQGRPTPPRELVPGLPEQVARVVLKAMAREPQARHATADELANDLQNAYDLSEASGDEPDLRIAIHQIFGDRPDGPHDAPWAGPFSIIARSTGPLTHAPPARSIGPIVKMMLDEEDETQPCVMELRLPAELPEAVPEEIPNPNAIPEAVPEMVPEEVSEAVLQRSPPASPSPLPPLAQLFEAGTVRRITQIHWTRDDASPESTGSIFDLARSGRAEPSIHVLPPDSAGFGEATSAGARAAASDFFAVRRSAEAAPAGTALQSWVAPEPASPPAPHPAPTTERRTPPQLEAAGCFDRGLAFLNDRKYGLALDEWERALALDPTNRTYQTNLKRLRARL